MAGALLHAMVTITQFSLVTGSDHSYMLVRLAKLKPKAHLSCSEGHRLAAKPPTGNANCPRLAGSSVVKYQRIRTELAGRRRLKLLPIQSTVCWIKQLENWKTQRHIKETQGANSLMGECNLHG